MTSGELVLPGLQTHDDTHLHTDRRARRISIGSRAAFTFNGKRPGPPIFISKSVMIFVTEYPTVRARQLSNYLLEINATRQYNSAKKLLLEYVE